MVFIETSTFTRQVEELLSDEEYRQLQVALAVRPDAGAVIIGSGGLRKLCWAVGRRGKCGGARLIYYWAANQEQIILLFIYPKNMQDDLTPSQLKALKKIVEGEFL